MKSRENRGEKPRPSEIRTTLPPLCEIAFVSIFQKSMLSVPTQNLSAKMHRNANLVRNCLYDHFPKKHALSLGKSHECENFRTSLFTLCEIRTCSLKADFSS